MIKIGILTSGGDSQGMNSAIRAIVKFASIKGYETVGILEGFKGLMECKFMKLNGKSVGDIIQRGGTILHTARSEMFKTPDGQMKAYQNLMREGITHLVVIGGDGSYNGALKLSQLGMPVYGLPGTIDNDIPLTDYTIGFDTTLNIVMNAVMNIRETSSSHKTISVVEVMGRNCGDIALQAGIASGADAILIPEVDANLTEIANSLVQGFEKGKTHGIVMLAEGVGTADELASKLKKLTNIHTRAINLGFIQRGGSPTAFDRILTTRLGNKVLELIEDDTHGVAIGIENNQVTYHLISDVLNAKGKINDTLCRIAKSLA